MRLAKYLAHAGVASRRASERLIVAGRVRVDGVAITDPAWDVDNKYAVEVDGRSVSVPENEACRQVWAVNKPTGVVSTVRDTHGRQTVVALVPRNAGRLYPVGRLDAGTTGLILLTDDGTLANLLTHPRYGVAKTYVARLARAPIGDRALTRLREGVELEDGVTAPADARRLGADRLELTLREGRKRQVRRMCEAVGYPVGELMRVKFGPLALGSLARGHARRLSAAEIEALYAAAKSGS